MTSQTLFSIYSLFLGLCLGSFLNVCIHRLPKGESIAHPRSRCPGCEKLITWYDNIPLVSFLFLRGQCRYCHQKISYRYPAIELLTMLLSYFTYLHYPEPKVYLLYFLFLVCPLIVIAFIDLDHQIIPDVISLPGIIAGYIVTILLRKVSILDNIYWSSLGVLAGGGSLFLISWLYLKLRKQEGLGGGDVKLAAMLGAFFGWKGVLISLFFASSLGSLIGVVYLRLSKKDFQATIPFGPFIVLGSLIYFYWGNQIIYWYLHHH